MLLYEGRPKTNESDIKSNSWGQKNLLLNVNGRIAPASVEKIKQYKVERFSKGARKYGNDMDSVLDRVIPEESLFIVLWKAIANCKISLS